ncbi:hypothetical protein C8Q77DRAFT_1053626 [Trametes polyzona]|nr:hypothetical protein C8Q77DRAFT_1053626 [Trametes polyzona]
MPQRVPLLRDCLSYLQARGVTLSELIAFVVTQNKYGDTNDMLFQDVVNNTMVILSALSANMKTAPATFHWCHEQMCIRYARSVSELSRNVHAWHFGAMHTDPEQIREFQLDVMANELQRSAPQVWGLLVALLGGWAQGVEQESTNSRTSRNTPFRDDPEDDEYWGEDDDLVAEIAEEQGRGSGPQLTKRQKRRNLLTRVRVVVIINILMQTQDQRCNALQSVIGIFLHSCGAPEKLIKLLSRMGISVAQTTIHRAIKSLQDYSIDDVQLLGRTLLVSYAFDNLDFKVPSGIPTIDKPADGLVHITTGTLMRLEHGVRLEDLRCAALLRERSEFNPLASDPRPFDPKATMTKLLTLHPEPEVPAGGISRRGRFRAWVLMHTLLKHGPLSLAHLLDKLSDPEAIETIPTCKLHQQPIRAMDISLSTITGNLDAIEGLYKQAGVGDPSVSQFLVDLKDFVTLFQGDLGTFEKVMSALRRRKQERTPYNRLDSVVFVLGLFHLKMAAADAIWRMLVTPDGARVDNTSFFKILSQLRPNDSSRLISNAKFRDRHDLINHITTLLILDAWKVEVKRRWGHETLEAWAGTKPTLAEIQEVAETIVREYIEGDGVDIYKMQTMPTAERDKVKENTARSMNYTLFYYELSHAMNWGDIGRVENIFPPWIQIFRAVGKHKYANYMLRFMHSLYFVYPEGLRYVHSGVK